MPTFNNGAGYFLYVGSISEVYSYNINQGGVGYFMDRNQPVLYIKTVDMFNQQTVETYDLVKRIIQEPVKAQSQEISPLGRNEIEEIIAETIRRELRNSGYIGKQRNQSKEEN